MRLSKRIAAVALAAVMAVSMLTACGGGGGGSNGGSSSSGSNNGSSSSSSSSGSGASSGSSSGSSSSSSSGSGSSSSGTTTDEGITTLSNSRTGIIIKNVLRTDQVCIVLVDDKYEETLALSGKSMYQKRANKSGDTVFWESIGDGKTNEGYDVWYPESAEYKSKKKERTDDGYNTDKMTVPYYEEFSYVPDQAGVSLNNFDQNQKVELGTYTYKKNGPVYHSETLTDNVMDNKYGHKSIYCYDNSGSLKLLVARTVDKETGKVVHESIAIVKSITYSVNPSLFKLNPNAKTLDELTVPPTN